MIFNSKVSWYSKFFGIGNDAELVYMETPWIIKKNIWHSDSATAYQTEILSIETCAYKGVRKITQTSTDTKPIRQLSDSKDSSILPDNLDVVGWDCQQNLTALTKYTTKY